MRSLKDKTIKHFCGEMGSNLQNNGQWSPLCPLAICVMLRCQDALPAHLCWGTLQRASLCTVRVTALIQSADTSCDSLTILPVVDQSFSEYLLHIEWSNKQQHGILIVSAVVALHAHGPKAVLKHVIKSTSDKFTWKMEKKSRGLLHSCSAFILFKMIASRSNDVF